MRKTGIKNQRFINLRPKGVYPHWENNKSCLLHDISLNLKIQYASDLHIEFSENNKFLAEYPLIPKGDILLLAGDITYIGKQHFDNIFFDLISKQFKETYLVPGNHEFYSGVDVEQYMKETFISIRPNVHLVNNISIEIGKVHFIFSTLWSKIYPINKKNVERGVNDFYKIRKDGKTITSADFNELHRHCLGFVQSAVSKKGKKVMVTHHVPTQTCNHPEYVGSAINNAFVVELWDFIETSGVDYWVYGHHHRNMPDVNIGKTRLLTNQLGYVHLGECRGFRRDACFEI
jgi:predicted phosphohydrolase